VLGIGLLGLAQLAVIAGVGIATASATDALEVDSQVISAVALAVVWFVLGYAFYATLFACAGALVPRQEELQAATMPLTLTILIGFFLSFGVLQNPDGTLARVSAFIPPLAPMTLPPRIALGEAGIAEIVGGVVVCVAAILALVPLAARIYSGGLLGTRTRVGVRDAWRGTRG
jgi:ABC-2 type transport system permease protein